MVPASTREIEARRKRRRRRRRRRRRIIYTYTDTPGLETFETNFQEIRHIYHFKTLLIVIRKGVREHTARLARHSLSQPHIDDEDANVLVRSFDGSEAPAEWYAASLLPRVFRRLDAGRDRGICRQM